MVLNVYDFNDNLNLNPIKKYIFPILLSDIQNLNPRIYTIGRDELCSITLKQLCISRLQLTIVF
jgi:hypothetical protein